MAKLTDLQLVLLSAAAQRDGGSLLPLPKRLKIEPGALTRVLKGLLKKKLVAETSRWEKMVRAVGGILGKPRPEEG